MTDQSKKLKELLTEDLKFVTGGMYTMSSFDPEGTGKEEMPPF